MTIRQPPIGHGSGPNAIPLVADALRIYSPRLAELVALGDRFHQHPDIPVLIEGETGTGKELFCQRIHHGGDLASAGPLIGLNCAAIAAGLFEAELFGYEEGAYTGAARGGSEGKLALARGGTLFLDEIADLPLDQQAKLLRVLESRSWYRVGGSKLQHLHARVICAANVDLLERVNDGRFRRDLYYRLAVAHLRLPPLRDEPERIPQLAEGLLDRVRQRKGRGFKEIDPQAAEALGAYPWPGNVRQLLHFLEEACLLYDDEILELEHVEALLPSIRAATAVIERRGSHRQTRRLQVETRSHHEREEFAPSARSEHAQALQPKAPSWLDPGPADLPDDGFDLDAWQGRLLQAALDKHAGSPVKTAEYLGITRKVLYTLRKRHGLL